MKPEYEIVPDNLQWLLRKKYKTEKDADAESIVGYFPKAHQALRAMYECMLRDNLGVVTGDLEAMEKAVAKAQSIYEELTL